MKAVIDRILSQYGQNAVAERRGSGEKASVCAFIQPVLRQREGIPATATPLGAVSRQRWLYIGSGGFPLSPGDHISSGGLELTVQEAQALYCRDTLVYYWALLRRRREAAG